MVGIITEEGNVCFSSSIYMDHAMVRSYMYSTSTVAVVGEVQISYHIFMVKDIPTPQVYDYVSYP